MTMEGDKVWIPNLFGEFRIVKIFDNEDDESPMVYESLYEFPPKAYGRVFYIDADRYEVWIYLIDDEEDDRNDE